MAPTLVSSTPYDSGARTATALVSPSIAVQVGDIIVCKIVTEDSGNVPSGPTNTGTALTWSQRHTTGAIASHEYGLTHTAPATVAESITVSTAVSGTAYKAGVVNVWRSAQLAGTPATNSTISGVSSAPSASITTVAADSVVDWLVGDWNTTAGGITYVTSSATPTQESQVLVGGIIEATFARQAAVTAGSQNFGKTAPGGQNWIMLGIEIQSAAGKPAPEFTRRRVMRGLIVR